MKAWNVSYLRFQKWMKVWNVSYLRRCKIDEGLEYQLFTFPKMDEGDEGDDGASRLAPLLDRSFISQVSIAKQTEICIYN